MYTGNTNELYLSSIQGLICFDLRRKSGHRGEEEALGQGPARAGEAWGQGLQVPIG